MSAIDFKGHRDYNIFVHSKILINWFGQVRYVSKSCQTGLGISWLYVRAHINLPAVIYRR